MTHTPGNDVDPHPTPSDLFEVLEREHTQIERGLDVLEVLCDRLERVPNTTLEIDLAKTIEFFQRFADRGHHSKEEDVLFPALERAGVPRDGGPIGVMLAEHDEGRRLLTALAGEAPDGSGPDPRAAAGRSYLALLRSHIEKENEVLFQIGRGHLANEPGGDLLAAARRVEETTLSPEEKTQLLTSLEGLCSRYL